MNREMTDDGIKNRQKLFLYSTSKPKPMWHLISPKHILLILWISVSASSVFGQSLPWFTQYRAYRTIINPAALRVEFLEDLGYYDLGFDLSVRNEGGRIGGIVPQTFVAQANWTPVSRNKRSFTPFFGGYLMADQFDLTKYNHAFLRFGVYTLETPGLGSLALGFNIGLNQFRISASPGDFVAPSAVVGFSNTFFNFGFGLFYHKKINYNTTTKTGNDLYAGFSVPYLRRLDLLTPVVDENSTINIDPSQYYFLLGANFYLSDYGFLEPSIWIKKLWDTKSVYADFNLRYRFRQPFWIGVGISMEPVQTFHFEVGVHVNDQKKSSGRLTKTGKKIFKIGLGYDKGYGEVPSFLDDSFELNISYLIPTKRIK